MTREPSYELEGSTIDKLIYICIYIPFNLSAMAYHLGIRKVNENLHCVVVM
jgi:hypothetical protein